MFCFFSFYLDIDNLNMGDFSHAFMTAVNEQNALLATIPKPATSVSLRDVLLNTEVIETHRMTKNVPFYRWIDECYKTLYFFLPHRVTIDDFTCIEVLTKSLTMRRISRAKLPEWVSRISYALEKIPFSAHQITNFINDVCDHCMTFAKSYDKKTQVTLQETVSKHSLLWLIEFAHALGTLLLVDGSIREFQLSSLCLAPNILWIVFTTVDNNGAKFARGIEVIQNTVKADGRICVVDTAMSDFLESVRVGSVGAKYGDVPEGVQLNSQLMVVDDIPITQNIFINGLVLPTPHAVLTKSSWTSAVKAGCTVSMALMEMLTNTSGMGGMVIDTHTGAIVTGSQCATVSWSDLCAFHFWPYISNAVGKRPAWTIERKRSFMSAVAYYNGGDDSLTKFVSDESWWPFLPFVDSVTLFTMVDEILTREHITVPLGDSYNVCRDFTFSNRHPLWQSTSAFVALAFARRYEECMCWLLDRMYLSGVSKADAERLHPLLRDEYEWTRIATPPHVVEETKDETLFRVLRPVAQNGGVMIRDFLNAQGLSPVTI